MKNCELSVVIVNFNGKKWLQNILSDLKKQAFLEQFEVIVVDNNSQDGSVEYVHSKHSWVKTLQLQENLGFASGNNHGYSIASGEYILFLNNDTRIELDYLQKFLDEFKRTVHSGVAQSKIVFMDNPKFLDNSGSFLTLSSFLYHFGFSKPAHLKQYNVSFPVFSVKGAAMMVSRDVIERIGLFDEAFWCYYEESDFCHRAWLAGFSCWYLPVATCYHKMGATSERFNRDFILYHNAKNRLMSFLKNFSLTSLVYFFPVLITTQFFVSLLTTLQTKSFTPIKIQRDAWLWAMKNWSNIMCKRKHTQELRKRSDLAILAYTMKNPRLMYYWYLFTGLEQYED